METLSEAIKGPEFWMSFGFVMLVVVSFSPVQKFLMKWGKKRARQIETDIAYAASLRNEAEELLSQYEGHTQNREAEKDAIIAQGENTVRAMQQEMEYALKNRIEQKRKDTADKIDLMHKTVQQNMKKDVLQKVVQKTTAMLQVNSTETEADLDKALDRAYASLEKALQNKA